MKKKNLLIPETISHSPIKSNCSWYCRTVFFSSLQIQIIEYSRASRQLIIMMVEPTQYHQHAWLNCERIFCIGISIKVARMTLAIINAVYTRRIHNCTKISTFNCHFMVFDLITHGYGNMLRNLFVSRFVRPIH